MNTSLLGPMLSMDEIKKIELDMLIYIDSICKANNIRYSLFFGTLLGAVRHKGFIPWDDDLDICVPIPDYIRLMELLYNQNDRFILRYDLYDEEYFYWHAKLVDSKTIAIESRKPFDSKMGVWVDIFPLCGVPQHIDYKEFASELDKLNQRVFSSIKFNYMYGGNYIKTFAKALFKLPFGLICKRKGTKYWKQARKALYYEQPYENAQYVGVVPTIYGDKTIYKKELFDRFTNISFEGHDFMCMEKWDDYLSLTYGDYMIPPPAEQRVTSHFKAYYKSIL